MALILTALGVVIAAFGLGYKIREKRHEDLKIINAVYGKNDLSTDVTKQLNRRIRRGSLTAQITNDIPGIDPAPHETKILRIKYWYKGKRHKKEYIETETIDLP